jgi:hypothetical protein
MLESVNGEILAKRDSLRGNDTAISIRRNDLAAFERRIQQLQTDCNTAMGRISAAAESKNADAELSEAESCVEKVETQYQAVSDQLAEHETMLREKEEDVRELERSTQDKNSRLAQNENRLRAIADQMDFLKAPSVPAVMISKRIPSILQNSRKTARNSPTRRKKRMPCSANSNRPATLPANATTW